MLAIVYLVSILLLPANTLTMKQYGWSAGEYHLVYFLVALPIVAVWLCAFYGYAVVREYATMLKDTAHTGRASVLAARGIGWLAYGVAIPNVVTTVLAIIADAHPGFHGAALIISNYVDVFIAVVAFSIFGIASRRLLETSHAKLSAAGIRMLTVFFVMLGVAFCYLVLRHFDLQTPASANNPFHLPLWLMLLTIISPYMYAWFTGLLSAYELASIAAITPGILYRRALYLFIIGIMAVIASSILAQYVGAIAPRTGHFELNTRLYITFAVRLLAGFGFLLMAAGVQKLKKIEEV